VGKSFGIKVKNFIPIIVVDLEFLKQEGIKDDLKLTIPNQCPEQYGVAETLNRALVEIVRFMLADSNLPVCT